MLVVLGLVGAWLGLIEWLLATVSFFYKLIVRQKTNGRLRMVCAREVNVRIETW